MSPAPRMPIEPTSGRRALPPWGSDLDKPIFELLVKGRDKAVDVETLPEFDTEEPPDVFDADGVKYTLWRIDINDSGLLGIVYRAESGALLVVLPRGPHKQELKKL